MPTIREVFEEFQISNRSLNKRRATLDWYDYAYKRLADFFDVEQPIEAINLKQLDLYRLHLIEANLSVESINTYLRGVRAMLIWAGRRGHLDRPPYVEFLRKDPARPKPAFDQVEFDRLLAAADQEDTPLLRARARAVLMVLFDTGMRASELCNAHWDRLTHRLVDGEEAHILTIEGAKRGGEREVILAPATWQAIKDYRDELARPHGRGYKKRGVSPAWLFTSAKDFEKPLTVAGLRRICDRLEEYSGIHANPHKFRRSFARWWINHSEGRENDTLMELAGWKTPEMIKVYAGYQTETLVRAARRNSPMSKKK